MSEDGHQTSQPQIRDDGVKAEDPNAPINVKARTLISFTFLNLLCIFSCIFRLIQVVTATGEEVFFKIKRNTRLSKLQGAYAAKVGKDVGAIRLVLSFFFTYVF